MVAGGVPQADAAVCNSDIEAEAQAVSLTAATAIAEEGVASVAETSASYVTRSDGEWCRSLACIEL